MNVYAGRDGIAVMAELPGVEKDDLEVHAHRDTLTLRGTRRPAADKEEAYHRRERRSGAGQEVGLSTQSIGTRANLIARRQ